MNVLDHLGAIDDEIAAREARERDDALFMLGAEGPSDPRGLAAGGSGGAGFNMVPWSHGAPGAAGLGPRGGGGGDD